MFTQNVQRGRPTSILSLIAVVMAGLWLTACSATTQGPSHLVTQGVTAPPVGAFAFCMDNVDACGLPEGEDQSAKDMSKSAPTGVPASDTVALEATATELTDAQLLAMARVVNAAINTAITYRNDAQTWDMEERWVLPITDEGINYGDCEDYALEKRLALLAAGAPSDRLRMATAWSPGTGSHAVLILRLDEGDYVLDNTTPHLLTVAETSYQWRALQTGPSLLEWSVITELSSSGVQDPYTAG